MIVLVLFVFSFVVIDCCFMLLFGVTCLLGCLLFRLFFYWMVIHSVCLLFDCV